MDNADEYYIEFDDDAKKRADKPNKSMGISYDNNAESLKLYEEIPAQNKSTFTKLNRTIESEQPTVMSKSSGMSQTRCVCLIALSVGFIIALAWALYTTIKIHTMTVTEAPFFNYPENRSSNTQTIIVCPENQVKNAKKPDWQLVFKAVSGVGDLRETDQLVINPYAVWSRQAPYNEDVPEARQLDTTFRGYYKSSLVLNWQRRNIQEIKVSLLDGAGNELIHLVFDGEGSNSTDWFTKDRLLSSPWTDLFIEPQNFFSAIGGIDERVNRPWFINRHYGGCQADTGWLVVTSVGHCPWEKTGSRTNKPVFLYSKEKTYAIWSNSHEIGEADIFAIFVKTKSRY